MALIVCPECTKEFSSTATKCPHCGFKPKRPKLWLWVPLGLVVAFFGYGAFRTPSPEEVAQSDARDSIQLCRKNQDKASNTPAERRFIAGACDRMEENFIKKYGRAP